MILDGRLWRNHKIAVTSVTFSLLEIAVVWGAAVSSAQMRHHGVLLKIASSAWILGTLVALVCAVVALIVDHDRKIGVVALIVALVAFLICGVPMLV